MHQHPKLAPVCDSYLRIRSFQASFAAALERVRDLGIAIDAEKGTPYACDPHTPPHPFVILERDM
jgi:hypothetical protein